jgi:hypothetical protein
MSGEDEPEREEPEVVEVEGAVGQIVRDEDDELVWRFIAPPPDEDDESG